MKFLRTLGLLLITSSTVWSMALETTTSSRYLEGSSNVSLQNLTKKLDLLSVSRNRNSSSNVAQLKFLNHTQNRNFENGNLNLPYLDKISTTDFSGSREFGSEERKLSKKRKNQLKTSSKTTETLKSTNKLKIVSLKPVGNKINNSSSKFPNSNLKSENKKSEQSVKNKVKIKSPTSTPQKPLRVQTISKPATTKQKYRISTMRPIVIKLTKLPAIKPTDKVKNSTPRTTITGWFSTTENSSDFKQLWYEEGVPYPNPNPEISSSSPPFSISDIPVQSVSTSSTENIFIESIPSVVSQGFPEVGSINPDIYTNSPSTPLQGVPDVIPSPSADDLDSVAIPAAEEALSAPGNVLSTFSLDMVPSLTRVPGSAGCPTVHIASSVLGAAQQRQDCSDLNLVLNSHYHQNMQDTRNPISTYDAAAPQDAVLAEEPVVDEGVGLADEPVVSDPGSGLSGGVPSPGSGGTGGSGGSGGSGGDGDGGGLKFPDLKPMFEAAMYIMNGLGWLLQKLMNPWLYIIPIVLFFTLGFKAVLTLFPWWIPLVFLYFSVRSEEKEPKISHVKHLHKPVRVKHPDGWFWNHETKTWQNVFDIAHHHRIDKRSSEEVAKDDIGEKIRSFGRKFAETDHTWKRRRVR